MDRLFDLPLWMKLALMLAVLGILYAGFAAYRHSVWLEGRDAALNAVAKQNEVARDAAVGVRLNINECFDSGGDWDVATGTCDRD